jgi:hypothetical protein
MEVSGQLTVLPLYLLGNIHRYPGSRAGLDYGENFLLLLGTEPRLQPYMCDTYSYMRAPINHALL